MGWICSKAMKVRRGDQYVDLRPGDPVPEAEFWPNPQAWERQGFIRWIKRETPSVSEVVPVAPVVTNVRPAPALVPELENTSVETDTQPIRTAKEEPVVEKTRPAPSFSKKKLDSVKKKKKSIKKKKTTGTT